MELPGKGGLRFFLFSYWSYYPDNYCEIWNKIK